MYDKIFNRLLRIVLWIPVRHYGCSRSEHIFLFFNNKSAHLGTFETILFVQYSVSGSSSTPVLIWIRMQTSHQFWSGFFDYGSGSRVLMAKNRKKNYSWKKFIFFEKNCNLLIPALRKGRPSNHFKTWNLWNFLTFYFCGSFLPAWITIRVPNPIRIRWPDWIRIRNTASHWK